MILNLFVSYVIRSGASHDVVGAELLEGRILHELLHVDLDGLLD